MRLAHERFADKTRMETGRTEAAQIVGCVDAAFSNADGIDGKLINQLQRGFEANVEVAEVTIVDAPGIAVDIADNGQLFGGMDLTENIELERVCGGGKAAEFVGCEGSGDKEDSVGMVGAGFDDLVLVHDEILAEAGDPRDGGSEVEIIEAALEKRLVREDGQRAGSPIFEVASQRSGLEAAPDEAF